MNKEQHTTNQVVNDRLALKKQGEKIARKIARGEEVTARKKTKGVVQIAERRHHAAIVAPRIRTYGMGWLFADRFEAAHALAPYDAHSMGAEYILQIANKTVARCDMTREYAKSCMWRAKHGRSVCTIEHRELAKMIMARRRTHCPAKVVGGLVTWARPAPKSNPNAVRRAWWVAVDDDGKTYNPTGKARVVSGYLVGDYHAETREEVEAVLRKEAERAEREAAEAAERAERKASDIEAARKLRGTFADSLAAGNCRAGTAAFCHRIGYGKDEGRVVAFRAVIAAALHKGILEGSAVYLCRIAKAAGLMNIETADDLRAVARA